MEPITEHLVHQMLPDYSLNVEPGGFAAAKFGGSAAGVSVGCLLGMAPLLFIDGHKDKDRHASTEDGE